MTRSYFSDLSAALEQKNIAFPVLVLDKDRLEHNCRQLYRVRQRNKALRIVAKSLPSLPLLRHLMTELETSRLMCFHLPFLMHLSQQLPDSDILMGKPMPIKAVEHFYCWQQDQTTSFIPEHQLQWLVDTEQRLTEYENLAQRLGLRLNVNLEVNIGLHRGGFDNMQAFGRALKQMANSSHLSFSGIMGYEAHITKIPYFMGGPRVAEDKAKARYQEFVDVIEAEIGDAQQFCLNTGGSTTYPLYHEQDCCNEIASASALVKPSDFDVSTLKDHQPALFIATPVLKKITHPEIPMASGLSRLMRNAGLIRESVFIYGGNWLAHPCHPEKMKRVDYFGKSSNQEMYSLAQNTKVNIEDRVFFRPSQSEAVMLQFGKIAVYQQGHIVDWWDTFPYTEAFYDSLNNIHSKQNSTL